LSEVIGVQGGTSLRNHRVFIPVLWHRYVVGCRYLCKRPAGDDYRVSLIRPEAPGRAHIW